MYIQNFMLNVHFMLNEYADGEYLFVVVLRHKNIIFNITIVLKNLKVNAVLRYK